MHPREQGHSTFARRGPDKRSGSGGPRDHLVAAPLLATLVLAPELLGGVFSWSVLTVGLACVASLAASLMSPPRDAEPAAGMLAFTILGCTVWTGLQATPLPCDVTAFLAPVSAERLTEALGLVGRPASWCELSRDPGATRLELLKGCSILSVFLAARLLSGGGYRRAILTTVALSAVVMALVATLHGVLGATKVFGLYEPLYAHPPFLLAPLMNPNTLGGFLVLGMPLTLALGMRARGASRATWLLASALIAGTTLLTLSRSAISALVATSSYVLLTHVYSRRLRGKPRRSYVPVLAAVAAVSVGVGAYLAANLLSVQAADLDLSKLELIEAGTFLIGEHPWLGVGRGAFGAALVASHGISQRFLFAESFPIQWASEWGVPVAVGLLAVIVSALWKAQPRSRSGVTYAAIVGLVGLGIQNLLDLGLELTGVAVVAAACLGAVVTPARGTDRAVDRGSGSSLRRFSAATAIVCAALFAIVGPTAGRFDESPCQELLTSALERGDRQAFAAALKRAVRLHPSEPAVALLAATEAVRRHDPEAGRWLNRAMQLAPGWPGPHIMAAHWLWQRGAESQALIELREAAGRHAPAAKELMCAVLTARDDAELALRAAPTTPERSRFLEDAARCRPFDSNTTRGIDEALRVEFPELPGPQTRHARRIAHQGRSEEALATLERLVERYPADIQVHRALAEILMAAGRYEDAIRAMARAHRSLEHVGWTLRVRARAEAAMARTEDMRTTFTELRGLASDEPARLSSVLELQGQLEEKLGNGRAALAAFTDAHDIGGEARPLVEAARIAEGLGDVRRALAAYRAVCAQEPTHKRACRARDRLAATLNVNASPGN